MPKKKDEKLKSKKTSVNTKNKKEQKSKSEKEVIKKATIITKEEKSNIIKNATFIERLGAFIIDMTIILFISILVSFVTAPIINSSNTDKLNKELNEVMEKYQKQEIDINKYMSRVSDINYDLSKESGLSSVIDIVIFCLYFIVFQYKKNGQTVGKKLLRIRIKKSDNTELSINDIMFRSLIIDFILYNIISVCIVLFASKDVYFYSMMIFEAIQYIILFATIIMILSRKDKRGIHDLITHTEVIKENNMIEEMAGVSA